MGMSRAVFMIEVSAIIDAQYRNLTSESYLVAQRRELRVSTGDVMVLE